MLTLLQKTHRPVIPFQVLRKKWLSCITVLFIVNNYKPRNKRCRSTNTATFNLQDYLVAAASTSAAASLAGELLGAGVSAGVGLPAALALALASCARRFL